jgi:hypothetical protein
MWMLRRAGLGAVVLLLGLSACGDFKQSFEDTQRASAALKSELGLDAAVSFRTVNGHTSVSVRLATPPAGDAATAKRKITDVVSRSFHTKVEHVELTF